MKILITTDLYISAANGVVTSVQNLYGEPRKRGHDVRILTLSPNHESYNDNAVYFIRSFSLEKIYPNVRGTIAFRDKYIDELIEWNPDVMDLSLYVIVPLPSSFAPTAISMFFACLGSSRG